MIIFGRDYHPDLIFVLFVKNEMSNSTYSQLRHREKDLRPYVILHVVIFLENIKIKATNTSDRLPTCLLQFWQRKGMKMNEFIECHQSTQPTVSFHIQCELD